MTTQSERKPERRKWKRIGAATLVVGVLSMSMAPAAQAGLGKWLRQVYWALSGVVQELHAVRADLGQLGARVDVLEQVGGGALTDAVAANAEAVGVLQADIVQIDARLVGQDAQLLALEDQVAALATSGGGSGGGSAGGGSAGGGQTGPVEFEELGLTRVAPPLALEMERRVFGAAQTVSCTPTGAVAEDALPPALNVTSTRFACEAPGLPFEVVVELRVVGAGSIAATFFGPAGLPVGLEPTRLEIAGDYRAPEDGPAFASVVTTLPAANAPGVRRRLEFALRNEVTPFEAAVDAFPGGLQDSSLVLTVAAAR